MSEKIVQLSEEVIKGQIKELVRGSVEETLNGLLEAEAEKLTQAAKYERSEDRQGYRSGHYSRNLTTTSGDVTLNVPRLKGISFETAIIERYRRRESSVEEALIEMYLAGVSVRRVEDITEALWGNKVSPSTISELNKKAYVHIEDWRNRPLQGGHYPYVYVDGIYLRRNWGGEYENVAILVAIAVNEDGYREVLGAAEGMKEDKASWVSFFQWLRGRGIDGVKLVVGDKCKGMLEAVGEVFPEAKYQRCVVHFYRNVFSVVPKSKVKLVAKMLKAIHAQESKKAAREKAKAVVEELRAMKLKEAAKKLEDGIEETLTFMDFPYEHWTRIHTNNAIEHLNREIRRRTRVVGTFPDGNSALMLVCARLRYVAGTQWGNQLRGAFLNIYYRLPRDERLWFYNMNALQDIRPEIDKFTKQYIDQYNKDDFKALQDKLQEQQNFLKSVYGEGSKKMYEHYAENKINDLYTRMGNAVLTELRQYDKLMRTKQSAGKRSLSAGQKLREKQAQAQRQSNSLNDLKKALKKDFESLKNQTQYERLQQDIQHAEQDVER